MGIEIIYLIRQNGQLRAIIENPRKYQRTLNEKEQVMPFKAEDIDGSEVDITYSDDAPYRVMFWFSTTCHACEDNFDYWNQLFRAYDSENVRIFGVCSDDPAEVRRVIDEYQLEFPVVHIEDESIVDSYRGYILPQTMIIAPQGYVQNVWPGNLEGIRKETINAMLDFINSPSHERR